MSWHSDASSRRRLAGCALLLLLIALLAAWPPLQPCSTALGNADLG